LLLTGLQLNEAAHISWSEIHGNTVIIPASRMKGCEGKAREHLVPLTQAMQEVIPALPRYRGGPYLFSYNVGKQPVTMTGPMKRDLDQRMLRTLKAMARRRGDNHHAVELPQPRSEKNDPLRIVGIGGVGAADCVHRQPGGGCPPKSSGCGGGGDGLADRGA
jgi:hypothetical protein